jgi:ribonuclease HI
MEVASGILVPVAGRAFSAVGAVRRSYSEANPEATSDGMGLTAAIEGLRALRAPCRVRLVSDSQYVKTGVTEFLPKWKANGWLKSNGEPVLNQDLWDQLDQASQRHAIHWEWTAGHADHAIQNRAHELALHSAREQAAAMARPYE